MPSAIMAEISCPKSAQSRGKISDGNGECRTKHYNHVDPMAFSQPESAEDHFETHNCRKEHKKQTTTSIALLCMTRCKCEQTQDMDMPRKVCTPLNLFLSVYLPQDLTYKVCFLENRAQERQIARRGEPGSTMGLLHPHAYTHA